MNQNILIGILGFVIAYLLIRIFSKKQKPTDIYTEVLNKEEHKVKGQWDK